MILSILSDLLNIVRNSFELIVRPSGNMKAPGVEGSET